METRLSEESIKKLLARQNRHANVKILTNPRVNMHIWSKFKEATRKADTKLSHIGEKIVKFLITSTLMVNKLTQLEVRVHGDVRSEVKNVAKSALGAVQMGALHYKI